jgi:hypothetical protein
MSARSDARTSSFLGGCRETSDRGRRSRLARSKPPRAWSHYNVDAKYRVSYKNGGWPVWWGDMDARGLTNKTTIFFGLLSIPILAWVVLVLPNYVTILLPNSFPNAYMISSGFMKALVSVSPLVTGDISVFGEITPIILAGALIALLPDSRGVPNIPAIALAVVAYFMFLHLSIYFSSGAGAALLSADFDDIQKAQQTLLTLISNVRVMAIVIAGAIVGINVKSGHSQSG